MPTNGSVGTVDRAEPSYVRRIVDDELDELLTALPAISLEGPRAVGKTSTALQRGGTITRLDDPATLELVTAQPARVIDGTRPVIIDEWQRYQPAWDLVRRACDAPATPPGSFILTGSASPPTRQTHSGAGRIVPIRLRPLTLPERGVESPTVSLTALLEGTRPELHGRTDVDLTTYTEEIVAGGFPGLRLPAGRARRAALDGYLDRIIDADLPEVGLSVRRPETLRRWLRAFAAAISTTTSYDRIRDAATAGEDDKPARTTTVPYREALERLWILDPLPAWSPSSNQFTRLTSGPKHHLADPALAARLLGLEAEALLHGDGPSALPRDGTYLGALFESLAVLCTRVFAQAAESRVSHLRTKGGEREIDCVVVRADQRVVALEVKLSATVTDRDVRHLRWLAGTLGPDLLDAAVLTTGTDAYRRTDGIGVIPLALLGP
ncbi:MAG: ATP-binding protein [Acidimicrobiales bacterium]|nr:ATP-binding protein [Acidimicrobiales bacterium]